MINIIYSEIKKYDWETAESFDDRRHDRLLARFGSEETRNEIYTSGLLIRQFTPAYAQIGYDENGRPFFVGGKREFNVTHSAGHCFAAWSDNRKLGLDFESYNRNFDYKIARRVCSEEEFETLNGFDKEAKEYKRFLLKLFTIKEAASKVSGVGIAMNFKDMSVLNYEKLFGQECFQTEICIKTKDALPITLNVLCFDKHSGSLSLVFNGKRDISYDIKNI